MRTQQIFCDKCEHKIDIVPTAEIKVLSDFTFNNKCEEFTSVDLCFVCTWEFTNWLKGETIDKQTKPQE